MRLGLKLTSVLTHIDFGEVGGLSDYRTSLFLKGERLFHTQKNTQPFNDSSLENDTTISEQLIAILYIGLSKASSLTTLRLFHDYFIGETTTIGYDYSSRNATTIALSYWLSGESPKKRYGGSR